MKKKIGKIILAVFCLLVLFGGVVLGQVISILNCSYSIGSRVVVDKENNTISVNDNDDIRILQLSDTQISGLGDSLKSFGVIKRIVEKAKPDMIVLVGDNIMDDSKPAMLKHFIKYFDKFKIPWATVMGNHDYAAKSIPMEQQCKLYESSQYCLFKRGDVEDSYGNYHYNLIRNGENIYTLMFMDNAKKIGQEHLEWYSNTIKTIAHDNNEEVVPSMLFFHKPLRDTYYAHLYAINFDREIDGEKREIIANLLDDAGIFNKALELGSTRLMAYGHNHRNNFIVDYHNIKLCYGIKSSKAAYYDRDMIGGNVYVLQSDNSVKVERIYV